MMAVALRQRPMLHCRKSCYIERMASHSAFYFYFWFSTQGG